LGKFEKKEGAFRSKKEKEIQSEKRPYCTASAADFRSKAISASPGYRGLYTERKVISGFLLPEQD
jgi:hypothetical protein